jgi:DNA-directed RNA polymerase subunit M/transcription elongation factor TFIIS
MSVNLTCTGCNATLKVRDDLAGKKIKCPKCATSLTVPAPDEEEEVPIVDAIEEAPPAKAGRSRRAAADEEDEEPPRRETGIRTDRGRSRDRDREDEDDQERKPRRRGRNRDEDEDDRPIRKSKYKPCPSCGASGAKKVAWTAWGSFYGPAMFTHVRCPECGYCYNGKTGGSNMIPAIIFVTVPLVLIIGILGLVFYFLFSRGWVG